MSGPPILVVEDDAKASGLIRLYLEHAGFPVETAFDGRAALERAGREPVPRLIVLDVMIPHVDGLEVCRRLRERSDVPIIMLTAMADEEDKLEGLDRGADDYVVKPFSPRELVARVRAVLRRSPSDDLKGPPVECGGVRLDPIRHSATVRGGPLELTPREFALLLALLRHPGRAFTRGELIERAFGADYAGLERTIDVHVRNLRLKLAAHAAAARLIETVAGVGYRCAPPDA